MGGTKKSRKKKMNGHQDQVSWRDYNGAENMRNKASSQTMLEEEQSTGGRGGKAKEGLLLGLSFIACVSFLLGSVS